MSRPRHPDRAIRIDGKKCRTIALTQNMEAIVDGRDYGRLSKRRWFAHKEGNRVYAWRDIGNGVRRMHHDVLRVSSSTKLDHRNSNGLDNRRRNLRRATPQQNSRNQKKRSGCSSRYKGVRWFQRDLKWHAYICVDYRQIHLGYFLKEKDAARAYDRAARRYFKSFARLNFPTE